MRNNLLLIGIFLLSAFFINLNAQTQPENASFEDWEDVGLPVEEPVNWSSIKTSDNSVTNPLAPIVWGKSTDARTGNYSLKLFNVETIGSIVASGTVTNGRVHADFNPNNAFVFTDINDSRWNTPCTDRPDSIAAWVKYFPQQNDFGKIRALLHTGYGRTPDSTMTNWIGLAEFDIVGQIDDWTRLSGHFNYFNSDTPEYILINMYSGNGTTPVKESWMLVDDLELIYNTGSISAVNPESIDISVHGNSVLILWKSENSSDNAEVKILDISGRTVWNGLIAPNQEKSIQLDVPQGIYICRIQDNNSMISKKIMIK